MPLKQKIFESNNKGLFDIAVGEGNISVDFATELQNARVALKGEVSKRRGRSFYTLSAAQPVWYIDVHAFWMELGRWEFKITISYIGVPWIMGPITYILLQCKKVELA